MWESPNSEVTLGGVALDVTAFRFELGRGADPVPQIIPIGAKRAEEFAKLGVGPHKLEATGPLKGGGQFKREIQGVYLDYVEATNAETGLLRLYDVRWHLQSFVCPFDVNVLRPDDADKQEATDQSTKFYRSDTAKSETEPATLETFVGWVRGAFTSVKFAIEAHGDVALPDKLLMGGVVKLNEALGIVAEAVGCDLTVDIDGVVRFVDRADVSLPGGLAAANWWQAPEVLTQTAYLLGAPKDIVVYTVKRWELILDLPVDPGATAAPRNLPGGIQMLELEQVYKLGSTYYTAAELATWFKTFLASNGLTIGNSRTDAQVSAFRAAIPSNIGSDQWLGTLLQTVPYKTGIPQAEANAAAAAKAIVDVVRRDYRALFRVVSRGATVSQAIDHWSNAAFGVLDQYGQFADYYEPVGGGSIGAVSGSWCELLASPISYDIKGDAGLDAYLGVSHPEPGGNEQIAPFTATWEDGPRWIVRLTPLAPLAAAATVGIVASRFLGVWATLPQIRSLLASDLIASDKAGGGDMRVMLTADRGRVASDPHARVRLVATQLTPNGLERFRSDTYPTGIKGATRTLEITATPDLAAAYRMDGTLLNESYVKEHTAIIADRIAEAYDAGAVGIGIAHGVSLLSEVRYPSGAVQKLALVVGAGQFPEFVGTEVVLGAASEADRIRIAREAAKVADVEARKRKPQVE